MTERSEAKRRWDREHPRSEAKRRWDREHQGLAAGNTCVDCDTPIWRRAVRCDPCMRALDRIRVDERRALIAERWLAGAQTPEIAEELGWTRNHLNQEMIVMRRAGWDLPYRYTMRDGKRVAA